MQRRQSKSKAISPAHPIAAANVREFLARHGRPSRDDVRKEEAADGRSGRWDLRAADGWTLRCDWVRDDTEEHLAFEEIAPKSEPEV